jgi:hypothetical protein
MLAILAKLGDFRGESRFTTWAYRFVILNPAGTVTGREVLTFVLYGTLVDPQVARSQASGTDGGSCVPSRAPARRWQAPGTQVPASRRRSSRTATRTSRPCSRARPASRTVPVPLRAEIHSTDASSSAAARFPHLSTMRAYPPDRRSRWRLSGGEGFRVQLKNRALRSS